MHRCHHPFEFWVDLFNGGKGFVKRLPDVLCLFGQLSPVGIFWDEKLMIILIFECFIETDPLFMHRKVGLFEKLIVGTFEKKESEDIVFEITAVDMPAHEIGRVPEPAFECFESEFHDIPFTLLLHYYSRTIITE